MQNALEEQKILMENEKVWQGSKMTTFEQALEGVKRDRDSMRTEVQTLSRQLTEALK